MRASWVLSISVGVALCAQIGRAEDWTQWRGPRRDAVSTEKGLLKTWPKEGPKLLWRVDTADYGYGAVATSGGNVFVIGSKDTDNEMLRALNASTGKEVWSARIGAVGNPKQQPPFPGGRSTPAIDGKNVYALSSDGDLLCAEAATGKEVWRKSLRADFGGKPGTWAYAESPLIDENRVVIIPGNSQASVVALDKTNGSVLWKTPVQEEDQAAFSSVTPATICGVKQYVAYLNKSLVGVSASDGKLLWRFPISSDDKHPTLHANTPIVRHDTVNVSDGYVGIFVGVKGDANGMTADKENIVSKAPCGLGWGLRIGDQLYGTTYNALLCIDYSTGKLHWEDRCIGAASICAADGRLYLHGEDGHVALVQVTPNAYIECGRFTPPGAPARGSAKAWAHPVVSNGRLYIRDLGALYCYDVKAK